MSEKVHLNVTGMHCQGCVRSVKAIISSEMGVERDTVDVDLEHGSADFQATPTPETMQSLLQHLEKQGFPSQQA